MKKIGVIVKETSERAIRTNLQESTSVFVVRYRGVASPGLSTLRMALADTQARMLVVKNTVARRALKGTVIEELIASLDGPCGLVFVRDEPVAVSKALVTFAKEHDKLEIAAGIVEQRLLESKDIVVLAKLPSKEVLRAQLVGMLQSPIRRTVMVFSATLKKFVYCLDQVRLKKSGS